MQTYTEITSDSFLNYMKDYLVGIGPWKDTVIPPRDNYLEKATDLVARAHALGLQVLTHLTRYGVLTSLGELLFVLAGLKSQVFS